MGSKSSVTIGYKYYLGAHLVICHGPVDSVQEIVVGDRTAWSGNVTASQQIYVNSPELFGGEKKEGGVQGYVDIMMGESNQGRNSYLQSKLGTVIPAFRGVLSLVLRKVYMCAMSPYPKAWALKVKRLPGKAWYPGKADINGSANPAHVIYETLTNPDWGMGYPINALDDAAFRAAADTLHAEGLGVSMIMTKQDSIESFIYTVLGHCNGMLYTRPDNGQFVVKLIREDYVVANLPLFNESNTIRLESFERPGYAEIVNEIVVTYRPQGSTEDDSVTVQDLAAIQAQQGVVSQTVNYPGIDTAANAAKLAMRDLRQKSTPFARIRILVNRNAWNLTLGDVFRFSWDEHRLVDIVFRVLGVNYGELTSGEIVVDAVEDMFGLPSSTYMGNQGSGWVDPVQAPNPFVLRRLEEANYWDLANGLPSGDFQALDNTSAFLIGLMGEPAQYLQNYELWTKPTGGSYAYAATGDPAAHATLTNAITPIQTSIQLSNLSSRTEFARTGTYALIDNEIVRVDTIDLVNGIVTVGRGCLDTVCAEHAAGARFWFAEDARVRDRLEYNSGETIAAKGLGRSGVGILDLSVAPEDSKALVGRFARPYAPGNFRVNSLQYPSAILGGLSLSWAHRDRTQQVVRPIIDHAAANIGPEPGVTYRVDIYAANGSTLLKSEPGLTGTSWTWTNEATENTAGRNRITVTAVRDGLDSYQSHDWYVDRAGLGNNLGNYLGGL